ncbi:calcium/sodium antiporter [Porphyromonadaceae bacterium]
MNPYLQLIIGLILLLWGGDMLVNGGVGLARRFRISSLVVGMTVVAFGTSAPELIVSVVAAIDGNPEIALGNVIGSNIVNIGLILGFAALILPIPVNKESIRRDFPMMLIVTLLFWIIGSTGEIGRISGLIGVIIIIAYTIWAIRKSRAENKEEEKANPEEKIKPLWLSIIYILIAPALLAFGADNLVSGASSIAFSMGVSERVVGVTIVAFGTSLPEFVASVMASIRRQLDISIGNIIGSNLFNICSVIGLTALIKPIEVNYAAFMSDFAWMTFFALLLFLMLLPLMGNWRRFKQSGYNSPKKLTGLENGTLRRWEGLVLIGLYVLYIVKLFQ